MTALVPIIGVGAQHRSQFRADRYQPCLVELALADGRQGRVEVDIGAGQRQGLADAQPGPVEQQQQCAQGRLFKRGPPRLVFGGRFEEVT